MAGPVIMSLQERVSRSGNGSAHRDLPRLVPNSAAGSDSGRLLALFDSPYYSKRNEKSYEGGSALMDGRHVGAIEARLTAVLIGHGKRHWCAIEVAAGGAPRTMATTPAGATSSPQHRWLTARSGSARNESWPTDWDFSSPRGGPGANCGSPTSSPAVFRRSTWPGN